MGRNGTFGDDEIVEWLHLFQRLRSAATGKKKRAIMRLVRELVEEQEILASADHLLVLRERPTKSYGA